MQSFESEIDKSIAYYRNQRVLTGDRIRDKTFHLFKKGMSFARKRDESLFDFWVFNGRFFGIEAKQTARKSLPLKNIKPHQPENLKLVSRFSDTGMGIFLVNFKGKDNTGRWNLTYALNVKDYYSYLDKYDRSSIELSYFQEVGLELGRVRVGFTKPRKKDNKPKPILGWDIVRLTEI